VYEHYFFVVSHEEREGGGLLLRWRKRTGVRGKGCVLIRSFVGKEVGVGVPSLPEEKKEARRGVKVILLEGGRGRCLFYFL